MNKRQKRFCEEYLIDLNATQAAIRAGYSEKTAQRASDWINEKNQEKPTSQYNPELREYIDEQLALIRSENIADATEIAEYLTAVMRREKTESIVVTLSEETTNYVPDANGTMRKQTIKREIPQIVEIPAKLSDANKAAELLGKRYGLFTDKVAIDTTAAVQIIDDIPEMMPDA